MKPASLARLFSFLLLGAALTLSAAAQSTATAPVYRWTTLAGRASIGNEDGPVAAARFNNPHGLALDLARNLYVADTGNHTIRKISPAGVVSTFAGLTEEPGSANGIGASARFNRPQGVAVDLNGNVYVADTGNHTIRKITPAGNVTTLAGQPGVKGTADGAAGSALFDSPDRLTVDTQGNVYLSNNGVRKISGGQVQTLPIPTQATNPDGKTVAVRVNQCPAVDATGKLYFATSVAGDILCSDSTGSATVFRNSLYGMFTSQATTAQKYTNDTIFNNVAGNLFLEIVLKNGPSNIYLQVIGGVPMQTDGTIDLKQIVGFRNHLGRATAPLGLVVDRTGKWYYTREGDDAIMSGTVAYAGTPRTREGLDGVGQSARLEFAKHLTVDSSDNLWIAETAVQYRSGPYEDHAYYATKLRKLSPEGNVSTPLYPWRWLARPDFIPAGITSDASGNVYLANRTGDIVSDTNNTDLEIIQISPNSTATSLGATPRGYLYGMASDSSGKLLIFKSSEALQRQSDGTWLKLAGGNSEEIRDGSGDAARFNHPYSLRADRRGDFYFLDMPGAGLRGMEIAPPGDTYIRKLSPTGTVSTAGKKLTGNLNSLAVDSKGTIFLTHADLGTITQIDTNGDEVVIGGIAGHFSSTDGNGEQARFSSPGGIVVDAQDNLYLIDGLGTTIRKGEYLGNTPGISTQPQSQTVSVGGSVQFSVTANSTTAVTYQWYLNGSAFSGATNNTLSFTNARSTDAGDYTVVVNNELGSVTSSKATLTVSAAPTPTATPTPASGGGGSIEGWFVFALLTLGAARGRQMFRTA